MFVRWKKRTRRRRNGWTEEGKPRHDRSLYAVLVENRRERGTVRQKVIKHLAHIGEPYLDAPAHQRYFWQRVDDHLDEMLFDPQVRGQIESKLLTVVPRPPANEEDFRAAVEAHQLAIKRRMAEQRIQVA